MGPIANQWLFDFFRGLWSKKSKKTAEKEKVPEKSEEKEDKEE